MLHFCLLAMHSWACPVIGIKGIIVVLDHPAFCVVAQVQDLRDFEGGDISLTPDTVTLAEFRGWVGLFTNLQRVGWLFLSEIKRVGWLFWFYEKGGLDFLQIRKKGGLGHGHPITNLHACSPIMFAPAWSYNIRPLSDADNIFFIGPQTSSRYRTAR